MSLHHKLCHTLGGSFNLPYSETHTAVLPHVLAYNRGSAAGAMMRIAGALKCEDAAMGVYLLAKSNGAPTSLRELGMTEADLDHATDVAMATPYWNPRPLEHAAIRSLLQRAFEGSAPAL
jgi:maleylacetate reductase